MTIYSVATRTCARLLCVTALALGASTSAFADGASSFRIFARPITPPTFNTSPYYDDNGEGPVPNRYSVAAGAALVSDYDGSDHYSLAPVGGADLRLHGHDVFWHGTSVGVDLVPEYRDHSFKWIFAPFLDVNLDRTTRPSDPVIARLPDLRPAVEGGAIVGFSKSGVLVPKYDRLTVQISASHDLGTVHHSFVLSPSVNYATPLSKAVIVTGTASFDVVGAGYARTYFGVDSTASATTGLPVYTPGGGVKSATLGLGGLVSLRGDLRRGFAIGGLLRYERLVGAFAESPLVASRGNPNQFGAVLGVAYTF
jgi:outer membrane scaffolding protein for murein synthesis (MipA/OmpV family)